MKSKIYCCLFLFVTLSAISQIRGSGEMLVKSVEFRSMHVDDASKKEVVTGSPYISEVYLPTKITGYDGVTPPMRYHAERDEMEFLKDGKKFYVIKMDSMEIDFLVYNKKYKYLGYQDKKEEKDGYLVVLLNNAEDNYSLFKKEVIILVPKAEPKSSYDEARPASYRKENDKFFIGLSDKIINMPTKKKDLLALVPNHAEAVEGFLKTNKISLEKEDDLIKLVRFMNTLK